MRKANSDFRYFSSDDIIEKPFIQVMFLHEIYESKKRWFYKHSHCVKKHNLKMMKNMLK